MLADVVHISLYQVLDVENLLLWDGLLLEQWHDLFSEGAVVLADKIRYSQALRGHVSLCFHWAVFLFGTAIGLIKIAGGTTWIDEIAHLMSNNVKPQTAPVSIIDGPESNIIDHNTC